VANGNNQGVEAKLWAMADALRNNMDAAEYKHVVLGLIFLKYISDAFEAKRAELEAQKAQGADPEDPDEYRAASIFWVPKEARWSYLQNNAPQPTIGKIVDDAMSAIVPPPFKTSCFFRYALKFPSTDFRNDYYGQRHPDRRASFGHV
jgi:type I restriction enzyme M protein